MGEAPEIYDLRGLNCPLPVLKTRKKLSGMKPRGRLQVETTDPLAPLDMADFCRSAGHLLVESVAVEGGHRFLIERG